LVLVEKEESGSRDIKYFILYIKYNFLYNLVDKLWGMEPPFSLYKPPPKQAHPIESFLRRTAIISLNQTKRA